MTMTAYILDLCNYTRYAIKELLDNNVGIKLKSINSESITELCHRCALAPPTFVFINQSSFCPSAGGNKGNELIKALINKHSRTLFFIFIANDNINFHEFVPIKNNVIIASKLIKISKIETILRYFIEVRKWRVDNTLFGFSPIRFSKTEAEIISMWMSGDETNDICRALRIKEKTVSSHKINIKRKIRATNKQAIYHLITIADSLKADIYAN